MKTKFFILPLILIFYFCATNQSKSYQTQFNKLSNDELKNTFNEIFRKNNFRNEKGYEECLDEILKRGGKDFESLLKSKVEVLKHSSFKLYENAIDLTPGTILNLELLTVLRRISHQPDPLQIFFQEPIVKSCISSKLPELNVMIKNVDIEKTDVGFTNGGDYRSGRQERWRIILVNEKGEILPTKKYISGMGGGLYSEGILKFGETWETSLDIASFIEIPPPGKYKLTVLYHNTKTIAEKDNTNGYIFCRSKTIPLIVKPLVIEYSKQDSYIAGKLVSELDDKKNLKIIIGPYGEWAHEIIALDSPEGKLLSMGLKAVPTIIKLLGDQTYTNEKRAWLFAILFSITNENDPRRLAVLGGYEYWEAGWEIWGKKNEESPSGGFSMGTHGTVSGCKISTENQEKLIKTWENWLEKIKLKKQ